MSGDELITITIEDPHTNKRISSRYSVLLADQYTCSKGAYHLMVVDNLIERFNKENNERTKV
jgi:hypothetical protein